MLANAHDDVTGYSDMAMIDVLGKNAWVKSSVTYDSASQKQSILFRYSLSEGAPLCFVGERENQGRRNTADK